MEHSEKEMLLTLTEAKVRLGEQVEELENSESRLQARIVELENDLLIAAQQNTALSDAFLRVIRANLSTDSPQIVLMEVHDIGHTTVGVPQTDSGIPGSGQVGC